MGSRRLEIVLCDLHPMSAKEDLGKVVSPPLNPDFFPCKYGNTHTLTHKVFVKLQRDNLKKDLNSASVYNSKLPQMVDFISIITSCCDHPIICPASFIKLLAL